MCWKLLIPQLDDDVKSHVLLQRERAPPHFLCDYHIFLGNNYPRKWIDRGCHISSLPRSRGLTPFDLHYGVCREYRICASDAQDLWKLDNEDFKIRALGIGEGATDDMGGSGKSLEHTTCYKVGTYRALAFSCEITKRRCLLRFFITHSYGI